MTYHTGTWTRRLDARQTARDKRRAKLEWWILMLSWILASIAIGFRYA